MDENKKEEVKEETELVKLNTEKDIVVDIKSMEDLINTLNYVTKKMNESKELLYKSNENDEKSNLFSLETKISRFSSEIEALKTRVAGNRESFQRLDNNIDVRLTKNEEKLLEKLPKEETIKSLFFQVEKLGSIDKHFQKLKIRTIAISIVATIISTAGVLQYFDLTKSVSSYLIKNKIKKENYLISKKKYLGKKLSDGSLKFTKINKK